MVTKKRQPSKQAPRKQEQQKPGDWVFRQKKKYGWDKK